MVRSDINFNGEPHEWPVGPILVLLVGMGESFSMDRRARDTLSILLLPQGRGAVSMCHLTMSWMIERTRARRWTVANACARDQAR